MRFVDKFEVVSKFKPTGDQPQAIENLSKGFIDGKKFQTLLGVTGSGKTFTMANIIEKLNKPTLIKLSRLSFIMSLRNFFLKTPLSIL